MFVKKMPGLDSVTCSNNNEIFIPQRLPEQIHQIRLLVRYQNDGLGHVASGL